MTASPTVAASGDTMPFDPTAPGERYFRHPGDVVRLVLWGVLTLVMVLLVELGTRTTAGVTADFGRVVARAPGEVRQLLLALTQVVTILIPVAVIASLLATQRWRRLGLLLLASGAGWALWLALDAAVDEPGRLPDAVRTGTWIASTRFPSLAYLAGAVSAATLGKPWLGRQWRRATDVSLLLLAVVMVTAGTAGAPAIVLAAALGATVGAGLLVAFGAPNRRPSPAAVADALRASGFAASRLDLERAEGGRAQLYRAAATDGRAAFLKVFGRDSRDADLLYRGYRALILRAPNDSWPSPSLKLDVEHEAFLLLLARQGGVACPEVEVLTTLPDGSMVLALEFVAGTPLDRQADDSIDDRLLDAVWGEVATLHARHIAHRALRAANILVGPDGPTMLDFGFAEESATDRMQAIDRAELLTSLAGMVGSERAAASAARVLGAESLASTAPFLQPLALSGATRKQTSKALMQELRATVADVSGTEPAELERLVRVRPRTMMITAALAGAFYVLLPQLANVDDSFRSLQDANWGWMLVCLLMSVLSYVGSAIGLAGGVTTPLPFVPNLEVQMASSFVNRVSPANVGGMALNVRFLQKAGATTSDAVTGVGLNSLVGALVHIVLLVLFFAWAGQGLGPAFQIPGGSTALVAIPIVLGIVGIVIATRRGRRLFKRHVLGFFRDAFTSAKTLARSPGKLAALFGGSALVTLAYIGALAAAVAAVHGDLSLAKVGAVYLGASIIAAAAPTPGGLGALEAATVAGLTGVGMASGPAVAAVLSYRLVTYWIPILPGWISFQLLEKRGLI
jgi:uncharacterized membrane protein YbhN (UPF0104 family)